MTIERQIREYRGPHGHFASMAVLDPAAGEQPGILYLPTFMGTTEADFLTAETMAARGYKVLVADFYGKGRIPADRDEAFARHAELTGDRARMRDILVAALEELKAVPGVIRDRVGAVGFCLGGMAVLDLARAGGDFVAGVCVHGVYDPPPFPNRAITAKLLVTHGWNDEWCPPEATCGLAKELTQAGCDWQILAMGHVGHAFTAAFVPLNAERSMGFDATANRRSWAATYAFFEETLGT